MPELERVKTALAGLTDRCYHYTAAKNAKAPYIVWAEDSETNLCGEGSKVLERAVQGTVDLFTRSENDPLMVQIPEALNRGGTIHYLNSVQYEDETGLIHYEWVFTAV